MLDDVSQVDQMPRSEGRDMSMLLSPDIAFQVSVDDEEVEEAAEEEA
jgi:hypothetical protein